MYVLLDITAVCHRKHIKIDINISLLQVGICLLLGTLWLETDSSFT